MAVAIHMFCTLQEAARRLHVSEEQIETMVQRGILREFREGPHRLLKAADVALLAETMAASHSPSSAGADEPPSARSDRGVRLPHCATVTTDVNDYDAPRPRITGQPHPRRMPGDERVPEWYGVDARQGMEKPPLLHYRPSTPAGPLSVREWFWMGLTQDRPIAILLLFALAVLILAAVVAGICMAAKVL